MKTATRSRLKNIDQTRFFQKVTNMVLLYGRFIVVLRVGTKGNISKNDMERFCLGSGFGYTYYPPTVVDGVIKDGGTFKVFLMYSLKSQRLAA